MPLLYSSLLARPLLRQSLLPLLPWLYNVRVKFAETPQVWGAAEETVARDADLQSLHDCP